MVAPLLPVYAAETLGAGLGLVGIVVAAPLVGLILVQPVAGQVGDHFGRRALVFWGLAVFALATVAYALAASLTLVILLRVLAGVGSGLVVVGTLSVVVDEAPAGRHGESISIYSFATNGGGAVGPLLGSALAAVTSFSAAVALSAVVASLGLVPGRRVPPAMAAAADGVRFRLSSRRLVDRTAFLPSGVLAIGFAGAASVFTLVPLYLAEIGSSRAGTAITCFAVSITAVRLLGRQLPDSLGHRKCAGIALLLMASGLGIMALVPSFPGVLVAVIVVGIGHGFAYPALVSSVALRTHDDRRATALGTFTALTHIGFVAWCIGLGVLASMLGIRRALATAGFVVLLGIFLAARLRSNS